MLLVFPFLLNLQALWPQFTQKPGHLLSSLKAHKQKLFFLNELKQIKKTTCLLEDQGLVDLQCWLTKPKFRLYIKNRQDLKHWKHQYRICSESFHFFSPIHSCKLSIQQGSHETVKVISFHLWTGLLPWISHCSSGRTRKPKLTEKCMEPLSNKEPWKTGRGGSHQWSQYLGGGGAGVPGQCLLHRKLQDKREKGREGGR